MGRAEAWRKVSKTIAFKSYIVSMSGGNGERRGEGSASSPATSVLRVPDVKHVSRVLLTWF